MTLTDLEFAPVYSLPASVALYRVQTFKSRPGGLKIGRLRLAPPGRLSCRFGLRDEPVGYFAERPETAGYESIARREDLSIPYAKLADRELICMTATCSIQLLDLRAHAATWPVLHSLRFDVTQALAASAKAAGFDGIIYKSAQQFGMDCMAIFGESLRTLRHAWSERLVEAGTGNLHWLAAELKRGAQLEILPSP